MTHISSLTSGIYSYMDVFTGDVSAIDGDSVAGDYAALFASGTPGTDVLRVPSPREFPAVGNAANITNVPVFGQQQSSQVSGQSDAPSMDVTINYVPSDILEFEDIKGQEVAFRFMFAAAAVTEADGTAATLDVDNTEFYWKGKIEAIQPTPSLTDSNTAVINISVQVDFVGPSTIAAT